VLVESTAKKAYLRAAREFRWVDVTEKHAEVFREVFDAAR